MATPMREVLAARAPVVELVGPAGSGKSTVHALLKAALMSGPAREAGGGRTRGHTLRSALRYTGEWLPAATALFLQAPRSSPALLRHLIRLRSLAADLPRLRDTGGLAVILDEGPMLSLAKLGRAQETAYCPAVARYTEAAVAIWAGVFDLIVYLDAPDAVLARRINQREKDHRMKGRSDIELRAFLAWYRRHYNTVIRKLEDRGVHVLRVDSGEDSAASIAARLALVIRRDVNAP